MRAAAAAACWNFERAVIPLPGVVLIAIAYFGRRLSWFYVVDPFAINVHDRSRTISNRNVPKNASIVDQDLSAS